MSEAQGQIVPVSRLGTISRINNGSSSVVATSNIWESGTVGDDQAYQALTLSSGSITANCRGWGYSNPTGTTSFSWTSTVVLTFDILAPSTFTLGGTADWFAGGGSVVLSRQGGEGGGGGVLFSYAAPGEPHNIQAFGTDGALAPGRYVFTVIANGNAVNPGSRMGISATLNVVPAPSAVLAFVAGGAVLTRRRRR